ncbi:MAG TPA: peptidylprolyl isomerase [Dehalococcoidia bacterium]|nr:peptidylprolyl isomerase [Dehalococcoidia bacterium]
MSRKLKPEPKLSAAKRQPPRWQRERNITLIIWVIFSLAIVLVLGLVGYWSYDNYFGVWHKPVAKIQYADGNETTLSMDYFVKMLRLYTISSQQTEFDTTTFPYQVLQELEDGELVNYEVPKLGIQVTPEEVTEEINGYVVALANMGGNETQGNVTHSQAELDKLYQDWLVTIRLSDSEYRRAVAITMLRAKLDDYFMAQVPAETEQVHVHAIMLDTEDEANNVLVRLSNGEDFAALASELSKEEQSQIYGGDLGWVPRGILDSSIDEVAFNLAIGNVSQPIVTSKGYFIVKVSDKAESMAIPDEYKDMLTTNAANKWLKEQRDASLIEEYLNQDKVNWAVERIQ